MPAQGDGHAEGLAISGVYTKVARPIQRSARMDYQTSRADRFGGNRPPECDGVQWSAAIVA